MKEVKEKLAKQEKVITELKESLTFLGKDLKVVQDENKAFNEEMTDFKLVNEELTKKMTETVKTGTA